MEVQLMGEPKVIDCFCAWCDLLGYGKIFKDAKWNLHDKSCCANFERIKNVKDLLQNPFTSGKTLLLNDGVIKTFDIENSPEKDITKIQYFLTFLIDGFNKINEKDKVGDDYGIRGVFTFGQRYEYTEYNFMAEGKEISVYFPKEFQMNTAFSKANIIEESGKALGIEGPFLYFDEFALKEIKNIADKSLGRNVREYVKDGYYYFCIYIATIPAMTLIFDEKYIKYNHEGIETNLYKLIDYKCHEA
jgi:hypothetical protein